MARSGSGSTVGIDPWVWFRSLDIDVGDGPYARKQEELYLFLGASITNIKKPDNTNN